RHSAPSFHGKTLPDMASTIRNLSGISFQHLGLSEPGFTQLLQLVAEGIGVEDTGFGRVELDVQNAFKSIYDVKPDALMFGTDLPSTRANRPFEFKDVDLIHHLFDEQAASKILYTNAYQWYFK